MDARDVRVLGAHPIARKRSFVVPLQPPKLCSLGFRVPTPANPLSKGRPSFFSPPVLLLTLRHAAVVSILRWCVSCDGEFFKKQGYESSNFFSRRPGRPPRMDPLRGQRCGPKVSKF